MSKPTTEAAIVSVVEPAPHEPQMVRNPLDKELEASKPKLDPEARYEYTWPGQEPKQVSGAELSELIKGADARMLGIKLVSEAVPARGEESDAVVADVPEVVVDDIPATPRDWPGTR